MGNFPTFCRVEEKLTEKETEEVIVILFFLVASDFCDESYICIIDLECQEIDCKKGSVCFVLVLLRRKLMNDRGDK